ncbi:MAG: hypothetical protein LHW64_08945 [Candidatus Cloacimonetes bacterium]|jgi:hypothetical protein|nr:hypothetical protein [Candidatus Cloacimonadota bacterium]MCB5287920.1 hypothetical protein [Candidatus Cloacimonadota bacterium]MCK9185223.1 hypothetical protein [Candidatus Cloacimonadota bacterium]MCK9584891.1 hypothetical protein [Candidatus Cloacimonadota bacterium]MDY0230240.1 hypothetical protein [Candidatus Cloacimonadaceae bacterium]
MKSVFAVLLIFLLLPFSLLQGFELDSTNRFSVNAMLHLDEPSEGSNAQFDWLLTVNAKLMQSKVLNLDAEAVHSAQLSSVWQQDDSDQDLQNDLYRYWLRASTARTELRVGLQRINFGSARLIRPLQWFDKLDPLDLLEQTEGAKAGLAKIYFPNNSTLWLWAILSDGKPKGNEWISTTKDKFDYGLRYEFPLLSTETGLSLNHRPIFSPDSAKKTTESRLALDIRYDTFAGLWLESSANYAPELETKWSLQSVLGADYTFGLGNGLYVLAESGIKHSSDEISSLHSTELSSSAMMNYPLGLLDTIHYLAFANWDTHLQTHSLVLRRSYDRLAIELRASYQNNSDSGEDRKFLGALISYTI